MDSFSFKEIKERIPDWIQNKYINPDDIPSIELYMDQVTTFMERQLADNKRHEEDKILTKTMINNYSKNNLLPPSDKKKYSKDHIILLIYIYYLKNFLSINDIHKLLNPISDGYCKTPSGKTMEDIYRDIYRLGEAYGIKTQESILDIYEMAEAGITEDDDYLKSFAMIALLSYDIYTKKQLVEKLIDSFPAIPDEKEEAKNAKAELKEAKELEKRQEKEKRAKARQQEKRDFSR